MVLLQPLMPTRPEHARLGAKSYLGEALRVGIHALAPGTVVGVLLSSITQLWRRHQVGVHQMSTHHLFLDI